MTQNILTILDRLSSEPSTNAKRAILESERENELLKLVFKMAYNPRFNYYLKPVRARALGEHDCVELSENVLYEVLQKLNGREVTGHAARDYVSNLLLDLNPSDSEALFRVINRDLECKASTTLANATWPDLIPEYPVMLADKMTPKIISKLQANPNQKYITQLKSDGGRFNARTQDGTVTFFSRNGNILKTHDVFEGMLQPFDGYVIDGELMVSKGDGVEDRKTGNGIFNKAVKGSISLTEAQSFTMVVWDIIPVDKFDEGLDETPYKDRLAKLTEIVNRINRPDKLNVAETEEHNSLEEVFNYYRRKLDQKEEGAIVKFPEMPWEDKRSKWMLKLKEEKRGTFRVTGWEPHIKNPALLGSLIIETDCAQLECNVGSGFKEEDRVNPDRYVGELVEVIYNAVITSKGKTKASLFLPIFYSVRTDLITANTLTDLS